MCSYVQLPCFLLYLSIQFLLFDVDLFPQIFHVDSPQLVNFLLFAKVGRFCLVVVFHRGGSATKGATPLSLLEHVTKIYIYIYGH